jgi:hypothetical protein
MNERMNKISLKSAHNDVAELASARQSPGRRFFFAWLPMGTDKNKTARSSVSLI